MVVLTGTFALLSLMGSSVAWSSDEPFPGSDHFAAFSIGLKPMLAARMDPIVQPGRVSGHVHVISGASNFRNVLNTPEEQMQAECASLSPQADKSNYWFPAMYYIRDDGRFEHIASDSKVYYSGDGMNVQPFPQGMRMVAGTAMSRKPDFRMTKAWNCQSADRKGSDMIPNITTFPEGCTEIMGTLDFPSCGWANGSLDSWDHFSHLTFPIAGTIICPPTHPVKYPRLFLEVFYYLREHQTWHADKPSVVLSNGDTTGYSFHADIYSSWDQDVLRQAMAQCTYGRGTGDGPCEVLETSSANGTRGLNCRYAGKIPSEDVGLHDPIDHLPGCNPLWTADMPDDKKPTDCPWYTGDPGWTAPNVYYNPWSPGHILPDALLLPLDANLTDRESLLQYKGQWYNAENTGKLYDDKGYFGPWGAYTKDALNTDLFKWSNEVMIGTNQEVWDNRSKCNATDPTGTGKVVGMSSDEAFTGVVPACTVPTSLHQSNMLNYPTDNAAELPPNSIQPACGATATAGPPVVTDKFLPGDAVQIKNTPNDADPYSHDYSWYGSGYFPPSDIKAENSDPEAPWWDQENKVWVWPGKEAFLAGEGNPAPGFNGTLTFTPMPTVAC